MISQITPAGLSPASRARSTEPSVWPVRTSTPPLRARSGNTWPGETILCGPASSAIAARIVVARSRAEMPVDTPWRASIETVNAVPSDAWLSRTIIGSSSLSIIASSIARQIRPRACVAMKLMCSGVTSSAANTRSPSFSRSSSSTRITILPARISSSARWTRSIELIALHLRQQLLDVLGEDVGLEVDAIADREVAERRMSRVCGMIATENVSASTALTVSDTPAIAIEPFSTM